MSRPESLDERLARSFAQNATYDAQLIEVMSRVLERDSNCIDIGAHKGKFVQPMVDLAPDGHHIAFEPIPELAGQLRADFPTVDVRETAVADMNGSCLFRQIAGDNAGYSGFERRPFDTYPERDVTLINVDTVRLDDALASDRPVRFIKIDVEGAELPVLRSAPETLRTWRPFIGFEHGADDREMFDLLADAGLRLSVMSEWLAGAEPLDWNGFVRARATEWFFLAHG
jgi:FkbM family methyltransferase